jgi:hypothetical protein
MMVVCVVMVVDVFPFHFVSKEEEDEGKRA